MQKQPGAPGGSWPEQRGTSGVPGWKVGTPHSVLDRADPCQTSRRGWKWWPRLLALDTSPWGCLQVNMPPRSWAATQISQTKPRPSPAYSDVYARTTPPLSFPTRWNTPGGRACTPGCTGSESVVLSEQTISLVNLGPTNHDTSEMGKLLRTLGPSPLQRPEPPKDRQWHRWVRLPQGQTGLLKPQRGDQRLDLATRSSSSFFLIA